MLKVKIFKSEQAQRECSITRLTNYLQQHGTEANTNYKNSFNSTSRRSVGCRTEANICCRYSEGGKARRHLSKVSFKENKMGIGTILLVILLLALVCVIPTWPHSRGWGYRPAGGVSVLLVIVLVLLLVGGI